MAQGRGIFDQVSSLVLACEKSNASVHKNYSRLHGGRTHDCKDKPERQMNHLFMSIVAAHEEFLAMLK